jgi:excisionase family DNA binding protein
MIEKDIIEIAGKRLIKLSTFAEDMGLHIRTVQLWAKDHEMPVIRVGNQMLLDLDDIPEWLDRHKSKPVAYTVAKSMRAANASSRDGETVHSGQT